MSTTTEPSTQERTDARRVSGSSSGRRPDVEGCSIDEAATRTGVSAHTLRYYERIGLLAPVPRGPGGHRRFTEGDLGAVTFLTLLRSTGMPIRDMQRFVGLTREGDHTIPDRVALLRTHRDALVEHLDLLQRNLGAINTKISIYEGLLAADQPPARPRERTPA